jgi:hypothetical protein
MWHCIAGWVVPDRSKTCPALTLQEFSGPLVMDHSTKLLRKRATYSFETSEPTVAHLDNWNPILYRTYPRSLLWEVLPLSCRATDCVSLINCSTNSDISIWKLLAVTHNHDNKSVVIEWCYLHYIKAGKLMHACPKMAWGKISLAHNIQCCLQVFYHSCPTSVSILWKTCIYRYIETTQRLYMNYCC